MSHTNLYKNGKFGNHLTIAARVAKVHAVQVPAATALVEDTVLDGVHVPIIIHIHLTYTSIDLGSALTKSTENDTVLRDAAHHDAAHIADTARVGPVSAALDVDGHPDLLQGALMNLKEDIQDPVPHIKKIHSYIQMNQECQHIL